MHVYKIHIATDQDAGLIRGVEVTTANVHDAAELAAILPVTAGDTYGDIAYSSSKSEVAIHSRGGTSCIVHTGTWGGAEALARLKAHNAEVRRVRARIEKVLGTCKRRYGLSRMRWLGLAKAGLQVRLTAMAHNRRRSGRLLAGVPACVKPGLCPRPAWLFHNERRPGPLQLGKLDQLRTEQTTANANL